jgi:hypothetical protein
LIDFTPVKKNKRSKIDVSNVDWYDKEAVDFAHLCPDAKTKVDFEYGSVLIVETAKRGPVNNLFPPYGKPLSKVTRELEQLLGALDRVTPQVVGLFSIPTRPLHTDAISVMKEIVRRKLGSIGRGRGDRDLSRSELARDAWSIWVAHGGDVKSDKFLDYVIALVYHSGFDNEQEGKKGRISAVNIVREIRKSATEIAPLAWSLWDSSSE